MNLLGSILGQVLGGGQAQGGSNPLVAVLGSMLSNDGAQGGLGGLVGKFQEAGLGNVVQSWIGSGENMPISADQITQVLGSDGLANIAQQLGLGNGEAAGQLSEMLPGLIDKLTPGGHAPEGGLGGLGDLAGMLGGLLKR
jgi:uncharacterized protein YidB (DUF937 family)